MAGSMRWITKALLAASLVLNVTLAWQLWHPAQPAPGGGALRSAAPLAALQRVMEQLPEADRAVLRAAVFAHAQPMRAAQQRYEQQATRVLELLAAEPLDLEALRQEIAAARASRQQATDELVTGFLEALPRVSAETRRRLAERGTRARNAAP